MKTDRYTKTVLTIIAICLVILVLKGTGILQSVNAGESSAAKLNYSNYGLIPVNPDGSINVHIKSDPSNNDVLDVNIETCSSAAFMNAEPIEVKIE